MPALYWELLDSKLKEIKQSLNLKILENPFVMIGT